MFCWREDFPSVNYLKFLLSFSSSQIDNISLFRRSVTVGSTFASLSTRAKLLRICSGSINVLRSDVTCSLRHAASRSVTSLVWRPAAGRRVLSTVISSLVTRAQSCRSPATVECEYNCRMLLVWCVMCSVRVTARLGSLQPTAWLECVHSVPASPGPAPPPPPLLLTTGCTNTAPTFPVYYPVLCPASTNTTDTDL